MEIVDPGPVWICQKCHCMLRGEPDETEVHYDDWFGHPESIDIGYHCPKCDAWNVCRNEIHPYMVERKAAREKRDQEQRDKMDREIQAARIALQNRILMRNSIEESTSKGIQIKPH